MKFVSLHESHRIRISYPLVLTPDSSGKRDGYFNYFDLSALDVLRYDTLNLGAARDVVSFATVSQTAEVEAAVRNHCSADCGGNVDVSLSLSVILGTRPCTRVCHATEGYIVNERECE